MDLKGTYQGKKYQKEVSFVNLRSLC